MRTTTIKDLRVKYTELARGLYLIDGEPLEVKQYKEKVPFKETIQTVTTRNVISSYSDGENTISLQEYIDRKTELESKQRIIDDEYIWDSLEDEFTFRKFKQLWQPIYKTIQEVSEPLIVSEDTEIVCDTGNPYITSYFAQRNQEIDLFTYNRQAACLNTVREVFTELGMDFKGNLSYEETKSEKIWGNSTHSVIRYVTAFGRYIFNDSWDVKNTNGRLEYLKALYEEDVKEITDIIKTGYNIHFGKYDKDLVNIEEIISKLRGLENRIRSLDVKTKSDTDKHIAANLAKEIKRELELAHQVE